MELILKQDVEESRIYGRHSNSKERLRKKFLFHKD